MKLAMEAAFLVNVSGGGKVETVFTSWTHFLSFFLFRSFAMTELKDMHVVAMHCELLVSRPIQSPCIFAENFFPICDA